MLPVLLEILQHIQATEESPEGYQMQKLIVKCFWAATHSQVPPHGAFR